MNAPTNPQTDLVKLHSGILADLAPLFPKSKWTVEHYMRIVERVPVPAISIELTTMEPAAPTADIGTNQFDSTLRFEAYVFTDYKQPDYRILSRLYAGQLMAFLLGHQWSGTANGPCRVLGAFADRFSPDGQADQYDCMRVEWEQDCLIGLDSWAGGAVPSDVLLGIAPKIGAANVSSYEQVAP